MNTGIQDAYNIAWKLALVLKKQAQPSLLETYNEERLANAKRLLQTTDQLFEIAAGDTWYQRVLRDNILPALAKFAWRFDAIKEVVFPTISQIGIRYPESALSQHHSDAVFSVKAGDRMPYFRVGETSIYDLLRAPTFHLLYFSDNSTTSTEQLMHVEQEYSAVVNVHTIPLSPAMEHFGTKNPFWVLLRPDQYIGIVSPTLSENDVSAYLGRFGIKNTTQE